MGLSTTLRHLYPDLFNAGKIEVTNIDGEEFISLWASDLPMPSLDEINASETEAEAAYKRSLIKPVTRRQFKLALLAIGLLDDVEAAIAASGDRALQINYAEALDFDRNNPFVLQMSAALGKTDAEIDALFQLAASL